MNDFTISLLIIAAFLFGMLFTVNLFAKDAFTIEGKTLCKIEEATP